MHGGTRTGRFKTNQANTKEGERNPTVRSIPQSQLTSECWLVQFSGLDRCDKCEFKNTNKCGGQSIRESGCNELGFKVPIGEPL